MYIDHSIIEISGLPLFERAKIKTPTSFRFTLDDRACFFYLLDGYYESVEPHGLIKLRSKEALVKKCGNFIARYPDPQSDCEAIAIYFYPELIKKVYKNEIPTFLTENRKANRPKKIITYDLIDKFIQNLLIYFENPEMIDENLAFLKLKELVLILLRSEKRNSILEFFSDIFFPQQLAFKKVIENNLYSDITMDELAFLCNKSLSSFKREFKKVYQESPARYIKHRRLQKAAALLVASKNRITDIAFDCGYSDITTFSSSFQKKFGESPRQYRLNQTGKSLN